MADAAGRFRRYLRPIGYDATRALRQSQSYCGGEREKPLFRGDDEATRFHTGVLNECLESVGTLDFEIDA
ncbi:hypothetical protein LFM09_40110 [Lentzea alba]|uniref:hypothetical protein n=1 Tax=Lentzea alba TaxID=2714351 RepID=UPI0039BEDB7E